MGFVHVVQFWESARTPARKLRNRFGFGRFGFFFMVEFLARDAVSGSWEPGSCQFGFFSGLFFASWGYVGFFLCVMLGLFLCLGLFWGYFGVILGFFFW